MKWGKIDKKVFLKYAVSYHIVGNFSVVQSFTFFTGTLLNTKIKAWKNWTSLLLSLKKMALYQKSVEQTSVDFCLLLALLQNNQQMETSDGYFSLLLSLTWQVLQHSRPRVFRKCCDHNKIYVVRSPMPLQPWSQPIYTDFACNPGAPQVVRLLFTTFLLSQFHQILICQM